MENEPDLFGTPIAIAPVENNIPTESFNFTITKRGILSLREADDYVDAAVDKYASLGVTLQHASVHYRNGSWSANVILASPRNDAEAHNDYGYDPFY